MDFYIRTGPGGRGDYWSQTSNSCISKFCSFRQSLLPSEESFSIFGMAIPDAVCLPKTSSNRAELSICLVIKRLYQNLRRQNGASEGKVPLEWAQRDVDE